MLRIFYKERLIKNDNILVSGPPRVSNTFVGRVLYKTQKNLLFVNHFHSPGQVINAFNQDIPSIIIIRDPIDTAVSLCIKYPKLYPWVAIQHYNLYYKSLFNYNNKFILIDFETMKEDFNKVIEKFNSKYGSKLKLKEINDFKSLEQEIFDSMRITGLPNGNLEMEISAPTKEKENLKPKVREIIKKQFNLRTAKKIYQLIH
jgi:hypothetical protein